MSSLRRKVATGAAWMVLARASDRVLGLASILVLARILSPDDFGIVAIASALMATLDLLRAFGFDLVLIQHREAGPSHFNTAFSLNFLLSVGIAILLGALAFPSAWFYDQPALFPVLLVLALRPLIGAFQNIGIVEFQKSLEMQKLFWLRFLTKLAGFVVTVPLALWLQSYWALVAGMLTGRLAEVVLSYLLHPFRPRPGLKHWREMMRFSKWLLAKNAVQFFTQRSADFTIAKVVGAYGLGLFNLAYQIAFLPSSELAMPINRAIFPGYARQSGDRAALGRGLLEVVSLAALLILPLGVGVAVTADLTVPILLGDQWLDAAGLIPILAACGVINALGSNTGYLFVALGQPRTVTAVATVQLVVLIPLLLFGVYRAGPEGAAWAYLIAVGVAVLLSYMLLADELGMPVRRILGAIWRPVFAAGVMAALVLWIADQRSPTDELLPQILWLAAEAAVGALAYGGTVFASWWLSGRPAGAEAMALRTLQSRLGRRGDPEAGTR